jgi:hypothetical protein
VLDWSYRANFKTTTQKLATGDVLMRFPACQAYHNDNGELEVLATLENDRSGTNVIKLFCL